MTRKVARLAFALFALVPLAADAPAEADRLKGIWAAQSITVGGQTLPDDPTRSGMMMIFDGAKYYQRVGQNITEEGTYTVDASRSPKSIDLVVEAGGNSGARQLGLYHLASDELTICLAQPGTRSRPKNIDGKSTTAAMIVLKRYRP
jgi:uncharacterized protein (TIGR03067 family)